MEDEYESLPSASTGVHMMAGAVAGIMEHCLMYPLDSVKTRLQSLRPIAGARYTGVTDALYKMIRYEGALRPVRGISAVVVGSGPAHALYFSAYEKLKRQLSGTENGARSPISQCLAGGLATLMHDSVMNPAEVVKQRMQMYNSPYKSCTDCLAHVWRSEGVKAFYRSFTTQLSMNIPFQCVHFVTYEFLTEWTNPSRTYNPSAHMISGAAAGALAAAFTTPLDVCKTLLNTQEVTMLEATKQSRIRGLWHAASTIHLCCGLPGFVRGLQARVMYQMPSTAIAWSTYELFKYLLHERHHVVVMPVVAVTAKVEPSGALDRNKPLDSGVRRETNTCEKLPLPESTRSPGG
ncbi:mitoferrin-1 [Galendromus occidentalis]|uniref:Mitoferrin-1 n=1 Tax=Galendromus occidentalis TaxID=34638 RepID=A0AAJ7PAA7_9ACAR|nr:mitoferrin-1 [Galendromus occidentalis]